MKESASGTIYKKYRPFYRRNLPHYQPSGHVVFVTFRLAGTIPRSVAMKLKEKREFWEKVLGNSESTPDQLLEARKKLQNLMGKWDGILDAARYGPRWLFDHRVAYLVAESIRYRDGKVYTLYSSCVMPNHVHVVLRPLNKGSGEAYPLPSILRSLKGYTARKANAILGRTGAFWQSESYDRVIRDDGDLIHTMEYVLNNPVKAKLVSRWEDWPWSYLRSDLWDD